MITEDKIYCSNAGDSRSLLFNKSKGCIELSYDHKPEDEKEQSRIQAAGGFV